MSKLRNCVVLRPWGEVGEEETGPRKKETAGGDPDP